MNGGGHNDTSHSRICLWGNGRPEQTERIEKQRTSIWPLAEFLSRVAHFFPAALSVPAMGHGTLRGAGAREDGGRDGAREL